MSVVLVECCVIGFGYMVVICLGVLAVFVYSMYYNDKYVTQNIKLRGQLESLPYCYQKDENSPIEIISGHHRVRAANAAGLTRIPVIIDSQPMTRSTITAKQIAANQLTGYTDEKTLHQLLENLTSVDDMLLTGLDDSQFAGLDDSTTVNIKNINAAISRIIEYCQKDQEEHTEEDKKIRLCVKGQEHSLHVVYHNQGNKMQDIIIISITSAYINYAIRYLDLPYGIMKKTREWWTQHFTNSHGGWEQLATCGWCLAPWVTALTVLVYNSYQPAGSINRLLYWWITSTCLSAFIAHYGETY